MQTLTRRERVYVPNGEVGRHLAAAQALVAQIKELEAELSTHRTWLLEHLERGNLHRIVCGDFVALRKMHHNWNYTPETVREMNKLRTTQKWEQAMGLAVDRPTVYLSLQTIANK